MMPYRFLLTFSHLDVLEMATTILEELYGLSDHLGIEKELEL